MRHGRRPWQIWIYYICYFSPFLLCRSIDQYNLLFSYFEPLQRQFRNFESQSNRQSRCSRACNIDYQKESFEKRWISMKPYRCWHHITELEENHSENLLIAPRYKDPEKASAHSTLPTNETPSRQTTGERDNAKLIIVQFEEADELNPRNWPFGRKLRTTLFVLGAGLVGGWPSANDSTITTQAQASFGVRPGTQHRSATNLPLPCRPLRLHGRHNLRRQCSGPVDAHRANPRRFPSPASSSPPLSALPSAKAPI
jgi:hypothetical protein